MTDWHSLLARVLDSNPDCWPDTTPADPVANRLGWIGAPGWMAQHLDELLAWRDAWLKENTIDTLVLLGMGGSSLAAEVFYRVAAPTGRRGRNFPQLVLCDTSSPDQVGGLLEDLGPGLTRTAFIVASKSGSTIETADLHRFFYDQVSRVSDNPGRQFIAITDPGSALAALAEEQSFARIFVNPPDIGGRYSALSYFGLVPAALLGVDLQAQLERLDSFMVQLGGNDNPDPEGLVLPLARAMADGLGEQDLLGLNLDIDPEFQSLLLWIEQLIAESTGKLGRGILPLSAAINPSLPARPPSLRVSVVQSVAGVADGPVVVDAGSDSSPRAGETSDIALGIDSAHALCAEFMRWELATALAAAALGINPFDQPDVESAKVRTRALIAGDDTATSQQGGLVTLFEDDQFRLSRSLPGEAGVAMSVLAQLGQFLAAARERDYVALLAYLPATAGNQAVLDRLARAVHALSGRATTAGFGPRYLHSTGQLHKGGPATGAFLQLVDDAPRVLPVPGRDYGFERLHLARADGDCLVLAEKPAPVMRIALKGDRLGALEKLVEMLDRRDD